MIPSFEEFQTTKKLEKYTFHPPEVTALWGGYRMTMRVTGPRGGENTRSRAYWGQHNRDRCEESLRARLAAMILRKIKK